MKKSIFILFLLLFSANITAENDPLVCHNEDEISPIFVQRVFYTITLESDTIFYVVEVRPEFPGGRSEMMRFLHQNLRIPSIYWESLPVGRVVVGFVVEKDGSLTNIEVVRGVSPGLDAEAVRVIEIMPKWTPGKREGKPVRVRSFLPVSFSPPR